MKTKEIRTVSYVKTKDGGKVRFDSLPPEVRKKAATQLLITYMNELFKGKAIFFEAGTEDENETQKKAGA